MRNFLRTELEDKILGKPPAIPPDGLVEGLGAYLIELGEIGIEHDLLPAKGVDGRQG